MEPGEDGSKRAVGLKVPCARTWNIVLRTAHIAMFSALVGGHVFDVGKAELLPWLYATLFTGATLILIEAFPRWCWFYQGRGLATIAKLVLLAIIPWAWDYRVPVLFAVIVIASVSSHMPGRYRYYSVIHRRVLE